MQIWDSGAPECLENGNYSDVVKFRCFFGRFGKLGFANEVRQDYASKVLLERTRFNAHNFLNGVQLGPGCSQQFCVIGWIAEHDLAAFDSAELTKFMP
jgi:hypothetical protein